MLRKETCGSGSFKVELESPGLGLVKNEILYT